MLLSRASRGWGAGVRKQERRSQCPGSSSSRVDQDLDVEASLVAVLLAVVDVLAEHPALDAQLGVQRQVGELQRHKGLLVVRVQQLAIVGVVLQREAAADAVVLDLADFASVLFFLEGHGKSVKLSKKEKKRGNFYFLYFSLSFPLWLEGKRGKQHVRTLLVQ